MKNLIGKRLGALIIDLFLVGFIVEILASITIFKFHHGLLGNAIYTLLYTYLLCRDSYNGVSIGRKLMKIRVVSETDGMPLSPWKSIYRNFFFMLLGPIEGLILVIKGKRLGDMVTKATVVPLKDKLSNGRLKDSIIAYLIIFIIIYVIAINLIWFMDIPFKELYLTL